MTIERQEWESIYSAIARGQKPSEFVEGIVTKSDPTNNTIMVDALGSEPVQVAALDYEHSIYKGSDKISVRSEVVLPAEGERVLVGRPGGARHNPRLLGVIRNGEAWRPPLDLQVIETDGPGNAFVTGTLFASGGIEVERTSEFDSAFKSKKDTDSTPPRFQIRTDGLVEWGPGNAVLDTNLYRVGPGQLKTDDSLTVMGFSLLAGGCEVVDDFIASGGRIQFGTGVSARDFTALKKATGTHNPASLAAHSGNVYGISLPAGTCSAGDLVIGFGIADPGNRGVQFHAEPTTGNDQCNVWAFNADTVALDHGTLTFHFVILNL